MRGSIAWPEGRKEGFAIMSGYDLDADQVIIFEQFRFWTVPHWFNSDGTIHTRDDGDGWHLGLIKFITDNLSLYRCCSYFWGGQHIDVWTRHARAVYAHPQMPKRLELIEVPFVAVLGPDLLHEKIKTRKFYAENGSILHQSAIQFANMQTTNTDYDNPALALMALLAGFDHQPWVKLNG